MLIDSIAGTNPQQRSPQKRVYFGEFSQTSPDFFYRVLTEAGALEAVPVIGHPAAGAQPLRQPAVLLPAPPVGLPVGLPGEPVLP